MRQFRELLHSRFMWGVTFSDLIYRYRQFLIAIVGAGVVFAMALAMTGLAAGFSAEINWTIGGIGADRWVLNNNAHGLISNGQVLPQADATVISQSSGVTSAAGLAVLPGQVTRINGHNKTVLVFGVELGNIQGFVKVGVTMRDLRDGIEAADGGAAGIPGHPWPLLCVIGPSGGDGGTRGADVAEVRARPSACG
jgi:hypothetical protein